MKRTISIILATVMLLSLVACGKNATEKWQEQYDLGVRYLSEGNYEEAIIAFTAAIEIDPKREEAYVGLADVYYATGDYESAERVLEEGKQACGELDEPDAIPLNAYGGTEFTARSIFRAYEEMSEQERYIIDTVANAAISNTLEDLYDMLDAYTHENDWMHIYTIWNDYKVQMMFSPYSDEFDGNMGKHISIEMRPENGIGVVASIYHSYAVTTEGRDAWNDYCYMSYWGSCPCKDWQWNGAVELTSSDDRLRCYADGSTKKIVTQSVETGTMKNCLRDGEFVTTYQGEKRPFVRVYDEGLLLSTNDVKEESVYNDGAGILGNYHGGKDRQQHSNDDLYW